MIIVQNITERCASLNFLVSVYDVLFYDHKKGWLKPAFSVLNNAL